MIDPRLRTLRVFDECGTVSGTAELTGLSPSAVSAQLRELQLSLGLTLLAREGRGLRLTAAGRHLLRRSDALVAEWERIRAETLAAGGQTLTRFGIGGFSTAASNLLAPLAAHLQAMHPATHVQLTEASPSECFELLIAEQLDVAVVVAMQSRATDDRFEQITLLDDPLDVMMPANHRFANRASVALTELVSEEWLTDRPGSPYHALFAAAFTAAGFTPRISHQSSEWETGVAIVAAGVALGLVPRLVSLDRAENVVRVPISGVGRPVRRIVATVRSGSLESPLIRESLDTLRSISRNILELRRAENGA